MNTEYEHNIIYEKYTAFPFIKKQNNILRHFKMMPQILLLFFVTTYPTITHDILSD